MREVTVDASAIGSVAARLDRCARCARCRRLRRVRSRSAHLLSQERHFLLVGEAAVDGQDLRQLGYPGVLVGRRELLACLAECGCRFLDAERAAQHLVESDQITVTIRSAQQQVAHQQDVRLHILFAALETTVNILLLCAEQATDFSLLFAALGRVPVALLLIL